MNKGIYTEEEKQYIRDNFRTMSNGEMGKHLGRSGPSVKFIVLKRLKLKRTRSEYAKATSVLKLGEAAEQIIRDNFGKLPYDEIGKLAGCSKASVGRVATRIGIERRKDKLSKAEEYVKDKYGLMSIDAMAKKLGHDPGTISRIADRLGLTKAKPATEAMKNIQRKIEGGSHGNYKASWHLRRWIKEHGKFQKRMMLFYRTGDYNNYTDLVLISKRKYDEFVQDRENPNWRLVAKQARKEARLEVRTAEKLKMDEKKQAEKMKTKLVKDKAKLKAKKLRLRRKKAKQAKRLKEKLARKEAKKLARIAAHSEAQKQKDARREHKRAARARAAKEKARAEANPNRKPQGGVVMAQITMNRRAIQKEQKEKHDEWRKNYVYKTLEDASGIELDKGKVPVKLDEKTVIFVDRDKCELVDGKWRKKVQSALREQKKAKPADTDVTARGAEQQTEAQQIA